MHFNVPTTFPPRVPQYAAGNGILSNITCRPLVWPMDLLVGSEKQEEIVAEADSDSNSVENVDAARPPFCPQLANLVGLVRIERPPDQFERDPQEPRTCVAQDRQEQGNCKRRQKDFGNGSLATRGYEPGYDNDQQDATGQRRVQSDASDKRTNLPLKIQVTIWAALMDMGWMSTYLSRRAYRASTAK